MRKMELSAHGYFKTDRRITETAESVVTLNSASLFGTNSKTNKQETTKRHDTEVGVF